MLNKKMLAERVGVTGQTLIRWDRKDSEPTAANVDALATTLRFPNEFFFRPDIDAADTEITSFRSLTSMSAAIREAALAAGSLGFEISDWVETRFDLPPVKVPDLRTYAATPDVAGRVLRGEWGLGEQPVSNMIHLLESRGVRVFSLAENTAKVDAYSLWRRDKPYVFLNTFKSAERSRFDAAHELGHLVMHQEGGVKGRVAEEQANSFASAFLMPKSDVLAHSARVYSLDQLIQQKQRWKVSLAALCHRLHRLELLTEWKYRDFCIEIATRGYNRTEPSSIERERSVVWKKVLTALWAEKTTHREIAAELAIPEQEVAALLFGILAVDSPRRLGAETPNLTLVDNQGSGEDDNS